MFSMNNDNDRMRFILIGILCTGFICVVIALCMKLSHSKAVEEIAVDELLQQYWQEQALDRGTVDSVESEALSIDKAANQASAAELHVVSDKAVNEQAAEGDGKDQLEVSTQSITEAAAHDGKIDINRATAEQLQQLKGIGPSKAKAIIDDREQKGSFKSIADIKRVKGIGEKLYAGIEESIVANP